MAEKNISVRVNITMQPEVLERLDENVERLRKYLVSRRLNPEMVGKLVTRSSLIREMTNALATDIGFNALKVGIDASLGLINDQVDWIDELERKKDV